MVSVDMGAAQVAVSEALGLQYRFLDWFSASFSVRHRLFISPAFGRDSLHSVQPELQFAFHATDWLQVVFVGHAGWSRDLVEKQITSGSTQTPAEFKISTRDSAIGGGSLQLRLTF